MAKIKTRICDVCGDTIYQHAKHTYTIRKRFWEDEIFGHQIDLCQRCYSDFICALERKYKRAKSEREVQE